MRKPLDFADFSVKHRTSSMLCMFILICRCFDAISSHIILRPYRTGLSQVAIAIIPQRGIESHSYEELGRSIQASSPFELWVCISTTLSRTTGDVGEALEEMKEELRENGFASMDYFLAGHGNSGELVQAHALERPEIHQGIILYGSCLVHGHRLSTYPLPVLTLSGELDGINRITRMVDAFNEILASTLDTDVFLRSPVIVLPGLNHGSYVSTDLPISLKLFDIRPEQSRAKGLKKIANITTLFMISTLRKPTEELQTAHFQLQITYSKTFTILLPILEARTYTVDEKSESYWVRTAQVWFSGTSGPDSSRIQVESYVMDEGSHFLPTVNEHDDGVISVTTFSEVVYPATRHSYGTMPQEPVEIRARMVGMDRIQHLLRNSSVSHEVSCKDVNYAAFLNAYYLASDTAQRRYNAKHRGIVFHDDINFSDENDWKESSLLVYTEGDEIHVTSMSWKTSLGFRSVYRQGLQFCKLLPPSRAIEWIYVDSLRDEFLIE